MQSELGRFINNKIPYSTAIIKYPSGRFGLVGSMPIELTVVKRNACYQEYRASLVWETEIEAINALLNIGKTHFQLSDCSWYEA